MSRLVLVPIEPTEEMKAAARVAAIPAVLLDSHTARQDLEFAARYKAALAAAPAVGEQHQSDPGEVEQMRGYVRRLEKSLKYWTEKTEWLQDSYRPHEIGEHRVDVLMDRFNTLRAQRSEQAALLREWLGGNFTFFGLVDLRKRTDAVLSASAEPSAPVEIDDLRIHLEAMCKLWPEDLSDDGSGRMGFKSEVAATVAKARAALVRKP